MTCRDAVGVVYHIKQRVVEARRLILFTLTFTLENIMANIFFDEKNKLFSLPQDVILFSTF